MLTVNTRAILPRVAQSLIINFDKSKLGYIQPLRAAVVRPLLNQAPYRNVAVTFVFVMQTVERSPGYHGSVHHAYSPEQYITLHTTYMHMLTQHSL